MSFQALGQDVQVVRGEVNYQVLYEMNHSDAPHHLVEDHLIRVLH